MKENLLEAISRNMLRGSKLKRSAAVAALAAGFLCAEPASAQLGFRPNEAVNTVTAYNDLGTSGTAINLGTTNHDTTSAPINIGFNFEFDGQTYTQLQVNYNGFIKLGTVAPSNDSLFFNFWDVQNGYATATDINLISATGGEDLVPAANQTVNPTEFRIHTTGAAGSQVTTIQFKGLADIADTVNTTQGPVPSRQFDAMEFQIKLYEGSNNIEIVYGNWTPSTNPGIARFFFTGLKGASTAAVDRLLASKYGVTDPWSAAVFERTYIDPNTGGGYLPAIVAHNASYPDSGRTFRFVPYIPPANDLAVKQVYSLGKASVNSGTPFVVKALIRNEGGAAVDTADVTLSITGVSGFNPTVQVVNLGVGQDTIVEFPGYTPTGSGSRLVEVTLEQDGDNSNNISEKIVHFTSATMSHGIYPANPNASVNLQTALRPITSSRTEGVLLSRFFVTNRVKVNNVKIYIPEFGSGQQGTNNLGKTVYATLRNSSGVEIARSADLTITGTHVNKFVQFDLTTFPVLENEEILVGLAIPTNTAGAFFPLGAQELDFPTTGVSYQGNLSGTVLTDREDEYVYLIEANVDIVTGVKDMLAENAVAVYPNPSSGEVFIRLNDGIKTNNLGIEVRNLQGQVILTKDVKNNGGETSVELNNLPAGMYLMHINTDDKVAVKRIVIQ